MKQFPAVLDLTDIKAVIDIGKQIGVSQPGDGVGELLAIQSGAVGISIYNDITFPLIDPSTALNPLAYPALDGDAFRVDQIQVEIVMDVPGALAANGKQWRLQLILTSTQGDPVVAFPVVDLNPWITWATGRLSGVWALRGMSNRATDTCPAQASTWNGIVPAGVSTGTGSGGSVNTRLGLAVRIISDVGFVFPANTTINSRVVMRRGANGIPPSN